MNEEQENAFAGLLILRSRGLKYSTDDSALTLRVLRKHIRLSRFGHPAELVVAASLLLADQKSGADVAKRHAVWVHHKEEDVSLGKKWSEVPYLDFKT